MASAHRPAPAWLLALALAGLAWPTATAAGQPARAVSRWVAEWVATRTPAPRVAAREALAHVEAVRLRVEWARAGAEELQLVRHVPAAVRPLPARPTAFRPRTVTLLPADAEAFAETFGRRPGSGELTELAAELGRFQADGAVNLGGRATGDAQVRAQFQKLAAAGATDAVVVAHSVPGAHGGRDLVLPGGARVAEAAVMEWAAEAGLGCRVVTCFSRSVGLDNPIPLAAARQLIRDATEAAVVVDDQAALARWDEAFGRRRDAAGASEVAVLGSVPTPGGGSVVWQSLQPRPPWLTVTGWVVLAAAAAANALVMWQVRRQAERPAGSVGEAADYIRAGFDRWRRGRRATILLAGLAAAAVAESAWLAARHAAFNASQGRDWAADAGWFIGVAVAGMALAVLAAVTCRTDPAASRVGRVAHALSGGVTGALVGGAAGFLAVAAVVAAVLAWAAVLRVIPNWLNGTGGLAGWAAESAWEGGKVCLGLAGLAALWGVAELAPAGYRGEPVYLRARWLMRRANAPVATEGPPAAPVPGWRVVIQTVFEWAVLGALGWLLVAWLVQGVAGTVLFGAGVCRTEAEVRDGGWAWGVAAATAVLIGFHAWVAYDLLARRGRAPLPPARANHLTPLVARYFSGRYALALLALAGSSNYVLSSLRTEPRFAAGQEVVLAAPAAPGAESPAAVVHVAGVPAAQTWHQTAWAAKALRGAPAPYPTGVVFAEPTEADLLVEGVVAAGTRAVVEHDDEDGADRGVRVRLVRDPRLGPDPGVRAFVRAGDLRPPP